MTTPAIVTAETLTTDQILEATKDGLVPFSTAWAALAPAGMEREAARKWIAEILSNASTP